MPAHRTVGAHDAPPAERIGDRCGQEGEARAARPVRVDHALQRLGAQEGQVGVEQQEAAGEVLQGRVRGEDRVPGAARLVLDRVPNGRAAHGPQLVRFRRDDDDHGRDAGAAQRLEQPADDRAAAELMDELGARRPEARAAPRCEHHRPDRRRCGAALLR